MVSKASRRALSYTEDAEQTSSSTPLKPDETKLCRLASMLEQLKSIP